jgi:hypothetical protein
VTNKTGLEFYDRIYWIFMQLVTTVHKSLSNTLSSSSTGHSRLLTTLHYSTTPFYSIPSSECDLLLLGTNPTENTVFCCQECVFIGLLPSNRCIFIVKAYASGICLPSRCLAKGIYVTLCWNWRHVDTTLHVPECS